jgi:proteic killer suppression protein
MIDGAFLRRRFAGSPTCSLDVAGSLAELRTFPGWRLHPLSGDLHGLWSLSVTANRRLVFRFTAGNAYDVDLVDYH